MNGNKKGKKAAAVIIMFALLLTFLGGCGKNPASRAPLPNVVHADTHQLFHTLA